jgi:hypothetical protein
MAVTGRNMKEKGLRYYIYYVICAKCWCCNDRQLHSTEHRSQTGGSDIGVAEDSSVLGFDSVLFGDQWAAFRRIAVKDSGFI